MALRHLLQRFSPRIERRWLITLLVLGLLIAIATFIRWRGAPPPLELVALGPDGTFGDTLSVPPDWADTLTATPDAVARVPLVLGVRNTGTRPASPEELILSVPVRYRITSAGGQELDGTFDAGSPLVRYTLDPQLQGIPPGRLPEMLPVHDTLWLEVVVPKIYCVSLADSIPEFVPAPPPPAGALSRVRLFYAFQGGDLGERRTGTLTIQFDSTLLAVDVPQSLPTFPMSNDTAAAQPDLGALTYVGSRRSRCGEPEDPMELLSTVWATPEGGRFIALDYGGAVRKHLYDLDDDGVIERESWDPDGDGVFEASRRAQIPIPDFLLPRNPSAAYPMARFDTLPPDSLERLDAFRRAMTGPGPVPAASGDTAPPPEWLRRPRVTGAQPVEPEPEPAAPVGPPGPLGEPVQVPPVQPPPDTGGR